MIGERADVQLGAETDAGYLVATITRERGSFSVTGEIHNSRRAFELGTGNPHSCGCIHDEILAAFPQLAPIVRMHLADAETGEPMHAASNGWYRLGGGDMTYDLKHRAQHGRGNYRDVPEPWLYLDFGYGQACEQTMASEPILHDDRDVTRTLNPAYVQFFVDMAARNLLCDPDELSIWWDRADFDAFVESLRPRWRAMADEANALIDGMESDTADPSEQTDEETFSVTLDAGLSISARLMDDEGYRDFGPYFQYAVKITAPKDSGGRASYTSTYGGSIADYDAGRINAREAAFGTARELLDFENYSARGYVEDLCGDAWEDTPAETRKALTRAERAFDRMSDALVANRETLGG